MLVSQAGPVGRWIVAALLAVCVLASGCLGSAGQPRLANGLGTADGVALDVPMDSAQVRAATRFGVVAASADTGPALREVAWRTGILTALTILAIVAFGFWIGIGERSYLYLSLTLLAQLICVASRCGALALAPWPGPLLDGPRTAQVAALAGLLASFVFMAHYLDLRARQPLLARVLFGCDVALVVLVGLVLLTGAPALMSMGGLVLAVGTMTVAIASMLGLHAGQHAAKVILVSLVPMLGVVVLRGGQWAGAWGAPEWTDHAAHAALALSGLIWTIGLTDTLHQLRRDRDQASRMATYDALTGALSRPVIEERLGSLVAQAHARGRPLSLVFFDIDRFKRVNDDHGHRVGDGCLRIIAMRTRNRLRTYDVLGRWGGDELLVILPDTRLGEALGVAENLRSAVNCRALSIEGRLFAASLSLGVAELAAGETAEALLERADAALYASKWAGRDCVTGQSDPRVIGPEPRMSSTPD